MATNPFWQQPNFTDVVKQLRAKREAKLRIQSVVQDLTRRTMGPEALRGAMWGRPIEQLKKSQKLSAARRSTTLTAMPDRYVSPTHTPQVMPDRVVPYTPTIKPYTPGAGATIPAKALTPTQMPDRTLARAAGFLKGIPTPVPAATKGQAAPQPVAKRSQEGDVYRADPGVRTGAEVYVDYERKLVRNTPTDIKLFNYNGAIIPAYRDENDKWQLSEEAKSMGLTMAMLVPAIYTSDLLEQLNYLEDTAISRPPLGFDETSLESQPLYYDPITNRITTTPTQIQFFWTPDGMEVTNERTHKDSTTLLPVDNLPMVLDAKSGAFIQDMISAGVDHYNAEQEIARLGSPTSGYQVNASGNVTMDQIEGMGTPQATTKKQDVEMLEVGTSVEDSQIIATTQKSQIAYLPQGISEWLDSNPTFNKVLDMTAWSPFRTKAQNAAKAIENRQVLKTLAAGMFYIFQEAAVIPKGWLFSNEHYTTRKSGFGDLIPSGATSLLMNTIGLGLAGGSFIISPFYHQTQARNMRAWSKNVWNSYLGYLGIMGNQLDEALLMVEEGPAFNSSPTQSLAGVQTTPPIGRLTPTWTWEDWTAGLDEDDLYLANTLRMGGVGGGGRGIEKLTRYVEKLALQQSMGLDLMDQSVLKYRGDLAEEAIDDRTEGLLKYYVRGMDWAALNNYIEHGYDKKWAPLQPGAQGLFGGTVPITKGEFDILRKFLLYNEDPRFTNSHSYVTGLNYMFLRQVAEAELRKGRQLTLGEMADMVMPFLNYADWMTPQSIREALKLRSVERHDRAQQLANTAKAYQTMGNAIAAEDPTGADAYFSLAQRFLTDGLSLLQTTYLIDRKALPVDPFASYTWDAYPEKEQQFYRNLAQSELQLGRVLTRQEILDISYASVDWIYEMGGEAIVDVTNFIPIGALAKKAGAAIWKGTAKSAAEAVAKGVAAGIPTGGISKLLYKSSTGRNFLKALAEGGEQISNWAYVRHMKGRALVSVSHKQAQAAADMFYDLLRLKPKNKDEFLQQVERLAGTIEKIQNTSDKVEAAAIAANASSVATKGITTDTIQKAIQVADTIEPARWAGLADAGWDAQLDFFTGRARKEVDKMFRRQELSADLEVIKINNMNKRILNDMNSNLGYMRLSQEIGDEFRQAFIKEHEAWTNSVFLSDTWMAKLGGAGLEPEKVSGLGVKIRGALTLVYRFNRWMMNAWVWATLARRPAWMLFNFIDNSFRVMVAGAHGGDRLQDLWELLKTEQAQIIFKELGAIPSAVSTDMAGANFRSMVEQTGLGENVIHLESILEFRDNPLGFFQHYKANLKALTQGKDFVTHVYSIWRAFPMSIKSLAQAIEFGSRVRLYYNLYLKNMAKIDSQRLLRLALEGATQKLIATGMSEAEAELWRQYIVKMWNMSGSNVQRFAASLSNLSSSAKQADVVFLPPEMANLDWVDEASMRPLVTAVADELQRFVTDLVGKDVKTLSKTHSDQFFDRVMNILDQEQKARVNRIFTKERIIAEGLAPNTSEAFEAMKAVPKYEPKVEPETLTPAGDEILKEVPKKSTKLSAKTRKKAAKALKENNIPTPDTDQGILDGVNQLRKKAEELEKKKPKPMTDAQIEKLQATIEEGSMTPVLTAKEVDDLVEKAGEAIPGQRRNPTGKHLSQKIDETVSYLTSDEYLTGAAYAALTEKERTLMRSYVLGLREHSYNFAGRMRAFWVEVFPGPKKVGLDGKLLRFGNTHLKWNMVDELMARQYENMTLVWEDILDRLRTGNFTLDFQLTRKEIMELSGFVLEFDKNGRLWKIHMYDPMEKKWIDSTTIQSLQNFVKYTGVSDQKFYTSPVNEAEFANLDLMAKGAETTPAQIAAKIIPQPFDDFNTMVSRVPRLSLAIKEGRVKDANIILASEFRYHMFYNFKGQLVPADKMLIDLVKKGLPPDARDAIKTLDDIPPAMAHKALGNWASVHQGYRMDQIVTNLRDDMIDILQNMFGMRAAEAREFFELEDKIMRSVATLMSDVYGKQVTKEEAWANVFYGFYSIGLPVDATHLIAEDGRSIFFSRLRSVIDKEFEDISKVSEIIPTLAKALNLDPKAIQKELDWNGIGDWIKKSRTSRVTKQSLTSLIEKRERLIESSIGRSGVFDIVIKDTKDNTLAKITANMGVDMDGNSILTITKVDGEIDEFTRGRLERFAKSNMADKLIDLDGSVTDLAKVPDSILPTRLLLEDRTFGSTDFVKTAMDRQAAMIKAYAGANITTALHEMFHAVEPWLPTTARKTLDDWADAALKKMQKDDPTHYADFFAHLDKEAARSEMTARAFEKYIVTEVAPTKDIAGIFKAIRNYLANIYRTMKEYFGGVYVTPEVRRIFEQMLTDGWKKDKVAKLPRPRKSPPTDKVTVPLPVKKGKKAKPKTVEDVVQQAATTSEMPRAGAKWITNGTFYPLKITTRKWSMGDTALDMIDNEIGTGRVITPNGDIAVSKIRAWDCEWVTEDPAEALKYLGTDEENIETIYPYFRILAEDDRGHKLIQFSLDKPKKAPLFQDTSKYQNLTDMINGPGTELRMALLELLNVNTAGELANRLDHFTPLLISIEDRLRASNWTLLAKDFNPAEREALQFLVDTYLDTDYVSTTNIPLRPVDKYILKKKNADGKLFDYYAVEEINLDKINDPNWFADMFIHANSNVWEIVKTRQNAFPRRMSRYMVEILESRGFDAEELLTHAWSYQAASMLIAGRTMPFIETPNTPQFLNFITESRVEDKAGHKIPQWHASRYNFTEFNVATDAGFHFGDYYAAMNRASFHPDWFLHPYWLAIDSPLTLPDLGMWNAHTLTQSMARQGIKGMSGEVMDMNEAFALYNRAKEAGRIYKRVEAEVLRSTSTADTPFTLEQATEIMQELYNKVPILERAGNFDARDLMVTQKVKVDLHSGNKLIWNEPDIVKRVENARVIAELNEVYGYDGIKYINLHENIGSTSWMAFYKNQIKRTDNYGMFGRSNPDVLFQRTSKIIDDAVGKVRGSKFMLDVWTGAMNDMVDNLHNLYFDPQSGFYNSVAMVEIPGTLYKPYTAYLIGNGFDYIARTMGDEPANQYIQAMAKALRASGIDEDSVFHMGGSRFVVQLDDPQDLEKVVQTLDKAPAILLEDGVGETWEVKLNVSSSDAGPRAAVEDQFNTAVKNSESTRAQAYSDWLLENGEIENIFPNDWEALDEADRIGAEIATHPYIRPVSNPLFQTTKKPKADPTPDLNEAWRAFVQAPIFTHMGQPASLEDFWGVLFGTPERLYKAGPKGFANLAEKLSIEFGKQGLAEQGEIMRLISELAKNFQDYVKGTVIDLDAVVPPPLGLWRTNPEMREWVSNMYGVGSDYMKGMQLISQWKDEFSRNIEGSPLANLTLSKEADKVLTGVANKGADLKTRAAQVANYGGDIEGIHIPRAQGAVDKTNFTMIDYTDFSQFDQIMKSFMPFWMYPSKSIPFWLQTLAQHPELVAFYMKYLRWSKMAAIAGGATTSQGEQLPSLKGYMPIMPGLWINPAAPLLFRYAFPRITQVPETNPEMTPLQHVAKFILEDASLYGFNVSPLTSFVLQSVYDPYYPKTSLMYETTKAVIPIEFIPPFFERWIMDKARQTLSGIPGIPNRFQEEVSWRDYLIERQVLMDALEKLNATPDLIEKEKIATDAYKVIADPKREENQVWLASRTRLDNSEYFRRMAGMFTGFYSKEFTPGQSELQAIRDEINVLRDAVNDEIKNILFKPYLSSADVYKQYTERRYKTPEGWIWSAYQMTRYVTDNLGNELQGQARRDAIAQEATIDEQTQNYYEALKAASVERDKRLMQVPVGADKLRDQIWTDYFTEVGKIDDDWSPNALYPLARKAYVIGYKPMEMVEEYITGKWWRQIRQTYPSRMEGESWEDYQLRVIEWKASLPKQAEILSPIFEASLKFRIYDNEYDMKERMALVPEIIQKLVKSTNSEGYDKWELQTDTVIGAIWKAYEALYLQPFYDAVAGKKGNDYTLAETQFLNTHTFEPSEQDVIDWIRLKYGTEKFTSDEISATVRGLNYATPEEITNMGKSDTEIETQKIWDILSWAGPKSSTNYNELRKAYIALGGYESDFDVWYAVGGDPDNYADIDEYWNFRELLLEAAEKAGAEKPTEQQLLDMVTANALNDTFKAQVTAELGEDFYRVMSIYFSMDDAERKAWRNENKDLYAKINRYYEMKKEFAADNPVWVPYYYPAYATEAAGGAGGAGGGGGYYPSAGSAAAEEAFWLPQGKRSTLDVMQLFAGKLGAGGYTGRPWWPAELLAILHPEAVKQVDDAAAGKSTVSKATVTYLKKVVIKYPEWAGVIRNNLKAAKS